MCGQIADGKLTFIFTVDIVRYLYTPLFIYFSCPHIKTVLRLIL